MSIKINLKHKLHVYLCTHHTTIANKSYTQNALLFELFTCIYLHYHIISLTCWHNMFMTILIITYIVHGVYHSSAVMSQVSVHMVTDEGIDWWSKYYASTGNVDKCRHYLELGYDKLQACYAFSALEL